MHISIFFLNLQFRTSEHNYTTRNQDLYKCRIKHEFARQYLLYNIPDAINNYPTNIKEKYFTHSLQSVITLQNHPYLTATTVFVIFLGVMFVAQFDNMILCITTKFPTFLLSSCLYL